MQLPIITSHRPTIGHRAIGAALATVTLAITGAAVWALVAASGGDTAGAPSIRTNDTTSTSLATVEAQVLFVDASTEDVTAIQGFADGLAGPGRIRVANLRVAASASIGVQTDQPTVLIVGSEERRLDVSRFLDVLPARERALMVIHVANPDVSLGVVGEFYQLAGITRVIDLRAD